MKECVLVAGGAGYIGTHTAVELIEAGYDVVIVDNLSNSEMKAVEGVREITGRNVPFERVDCDDRQALAGVFDRYRFGAVIHFAASKAVGESVEKPLLYYRNNILSLLNVLDLMREKGVRNLVFSSSCTVYGQPEALPVTEQTPRQPATSPYGNTKQICEDILRDTVAAYPELCGIALRYFNPIGAHPSALIGELPKGVPGNLVPFITQAHVVAVGRMIGGKGKNRYEYFNIGTGRGRSVLELVSLFERATGVRVPHKIVGRRTGDIEKIWADTSYANRELGWKAERSIEDTLRSAWAWEKRLRGIE